MDRRVTIENHFEQKDFSYELNEEREYKKYGMYFYNTKIFYSCAWSDYFSGNSFFEILANFAGVQDLNEDNYDILDKINDTLNRYIDTNNFHSDAYNYLAWEDDPLDLDFEKWAKLLVRDLYNYDIVSPFKYYKFTYNTYLKYIILWISFILLSTIIVNILIAVYLNSTKKRNLVYKIFT